MVGQTAWHCSSLLCQHHGFKRNSLILQHYCQEVSAHPLSLLAHHLLFSLFFSSLINSHWLFFSCIFSFQSSHTSYCRLFRLWWMRSWCCRMRLVSYRCASLRSWQRVMGMLGNSWPCSLLSLYWEKGWPPFEWRLRGNGSCWRWFTKSSYFF